MFANLTGWHLLIVLAALLLLFGATRLPALARSLGRSAREFKGEIREMKRDEEGVRRGGGLLPGLPGQPARGAVGAAGGSGSSRVGRSRVNRARNPSRSRMGARSIGTSRPVNRRRRGTDGAYRSSRSSVR
jgi:sec-independent protein translocase protein TatA